jgi:16S rRNA (guanine527-N7)-methyltransferase
MTDTPRAVLIEGLSTLRLAATEAQLDQLMALTELLADWNQRVNLTAITEPFAMVRKHLLDSLTVQPWLSGPFVIDVGTGAGFPGLPLAILNPTFRFTLLDSTAKKIRFVEHAIRTLGLGEVDAVCVRAEQFKPTQRATSVVSRALSTIPEFIRYAGHLVAKSGTLLAMKGRDPSAELVSLPREWQVAGIERLAVPGLTDERHLVRLVRPLAH